MRIMVVGGAGYIGSHTAKILHTQGHEVLILDNLSTGKMDLVKYGDFILCDILDRKALSLVFEKNKVDAVMHFAACSQVGESIVSPDKYYRNNLLGTLNILDVMIENNMKNIVFSSTAAVYGVPESLPITEKHSQTPINPYGASKLMVERMLQDYNHAYGLRSVCLRYFNACGADPLGEIGECHEPETHLIPNILQAASGRKNSIKVFGNDYPTEDGTCIRDYIHVNDLCTAHLLALNYIVADQGQASAFNLGNGKGFSVQQVIDAAKKIVSEDGYSFKVEYEKRRQGDPAILVADSTKALRVLGWSPEYTDLESIVRHAWVWEKKMSGLKRVCQ